MSHQTHPENDFIYVELAEMFAILSVALQLAQLTRSANKTQFVSVGWE